MQQDFPEFKTQSGTVTDQELEDSEAYKFLTQSQAEEYRKRQDLLEAFERNRRRIFKEEKITDQKSTFEAPSFSATDEGYMSPDERKTYLQTLGKSPRSMPFAGRQVKLGIEDVKTTFNLATDLLSTEAEIAGYGLRNSNNWLRIGSAFGLFAEKPEATEALRSLLPWEKRDMSVRETIAKVADIHETRPLPEQVFFGIGSPSSLIGGVPAASGKVVTAGIKAGHKATDAMQVLQKIIDDIPIHALTDPDQRNAYQAASKEMIENVMDQPLKIPGLPDNAVFESDLRLWMNMPADTAVNMSQYYDDVTGAAASIRDIPLNFGSSKSASASQVNQANDSLKRLENIGLIEPVEPNVYRKAVQAGSPEAKDILHHYGNIIGIEGASDANFYIRDILGIEHTVGTVVSIESPIMRALAAKTGINPSVLAKTDVQKAVIAYARENSSIQELVEVALQAGLDFHTGKAFGSKIAGSVLAKSPINIDKDGVVKEVGVLWMDVFSAPKGTYDDVLSTEALAYIEDYRRIVDEMEALRLKHGLKSLSKDRGGWYYIPRQALGQDDIKFLQASDSHMQRTLDTATEGRMGRIDPDTGKVLDEVKYQTDPRANLKTHLMAAYHEILDEDLSAYFLKQQVSFAPTDILKTAAPKLFARSEAAGKNLLAKRAKLRKLTNELTEAPITREPEIGTGVSRRIESIEQGAKARKAIQTQIAKARSEYVGARKEFLAVRSERTRKLNLIKSAPGLPDTLWGETGNKKIPVKMWRNRIFREEDYDALEAGIGHLAGKGGTWSSHLGRVIDVSRWLQANGDFGAPFIQGLTLLWRRPDIWGQAVGKSFQAFLMPSTQARYVRGNIGILREMAAYGVPLGDVEFFAALQKGRGIPVGKVIDFLPKEEGSLFLGKIVGEEILTNKQMREAVLKTGRAGEAVRGRTQYALGQQVAGRFQNSYSSFLAIARAELWKGMKTSWTESTRQGNTLDELAAYIRNLTGGLDSKALGVSASRREIEGAWMAFSPRLLRSTVALVADAIRFVPAEIGRAGGGQGATVRQTEAMRSLAAMLTGIHGLYITAEVGNGRAKGWSQERIENEVARGLNPLSGGGYLSIEVDGQFYGVGGQVRAITQLMVAVAASLAPGGPPIEELLANTSRDNPMLQYLTYRGAIAPELVRTGIEGFTDIDALPFDNVDGTVDVTKHLFSSSLPFAVQGKMEGDTAPGVGFGAAGFRSRPLQPRDIEEKLTKEAFYKMSPEDLAYYEHTAGDWPGMKNLSSELRAKIIEESPEIQKARKDNLELKMEMGGEYGEYTAKRIEKQTIRNETIESEHARLGTGMDFRERIDEINTEYGNRLDEINTLYEKLLSEFEETNPSHPFDIAKDMYFKTLYNKDFPLENPTTGEFDYEEYESRIDALKEDPDVGPYFTRIEIQIAANQPPIIGDLKHDREYLKPYWKITDNVLEDYEFTDKYELFITETGTTPRHMKEGAVKTDDLDWSYADSITLQAVLREIDRQKLEMRTGQPDPNDPDAPNPAAIDALLWKWGYVAVLQNYTAIDWESQIRIRPDQYGVISNKEIINDFIPLPRYQVGR